MTYSLGRERSARDRTKQQQSEDEYLHIHLTRLSFQYKATEDITVSYLEIRTRERNFMLRGYATSRDVTNDSRKKTIHLKSLWDLLDVVSSI